MDITINQTQTWESGKSGIYGNIEPGYAAQFEALHAARWPQDLENGRKAGMAFAERVKG